MTVRKLLLVKHSLSKEFSTLIPDVYALLEGRLIVDPLVVQKYGKQIGDILVKQISGADHRDSTKLTMSSVGQPLRKLWYQLNGYEGEAFKGPTLFKFAFGHFLEAIFLLLAEGAGHRVERPQEEIQVDGVKGHIDALIDGELIDVKSCSPHSYDKFASGSLLTDDPFGYVGQLSGYASALGLDHAWFVAIDKVHGKICTLRIEVKDYDIKAKIASIKEAVKQTEPPERCYEDEPHQKSGNRKLSIGCSYCAWKFLCWPDVKVYPYSSGPVFLTHVAREPNLKSNTTFPTREGDI